MSTENQEKNDQENKTTTSSDDNSSANKAKENQKINDNHDEDDDSDDENFSDNSSDSNQSQKNRHPDANELKRLRKDNRKMRTEMDELKKLVNDVGEKANLASTEALSLKKSYEQRLIDAELKVAADNHGLQDIDAFKMADLSTIKVGKNGEVSGIKEILENLKTNKPYLFKANVTTSSNVRISNNKSESEGRKSLRDVSAEEAKKNEAEFLKSIR